ncbi:hypothetical protein TorRG33x02_031140 [Trema orientale]|uniref:Uncharacterized protein n=1 Tax=Trema orientale TaxID=63057 RepID=A0A2P5FT25_TREOI|nr:hypothetical protein TorRG33x02_031140 [Trema orientale]
MPMKTCLVAHFQIKNLKIFPKKSENLKTSILHFQKLLCLLRPPSLSKLVGDPFKDFPSPAQSLLRPSLTSGKFGHRRCPNRLEGDAGGPHVRSGRSKSEQRRGQGQG